MVVLVDGNRLTGILVDTVTGRQEILVKTLGRFVKRVPFVMGCAILRDSKLVLILDPRQIVEAVTQTDGLQLNARQASHRADVAQPSVLVVDDSHIQRENLKAILKHTNYRVETAENGFDALKACRQKTFAAFCVDIMMPLMDGYEFVERLRKIPAYKDAPVFLITAKDSDSHRTAALNVSRVLRKPVDGTELIGLLDASLAEGGVTE
jgi:CheY-like chemotaxis protein